MLHYLQQSRALCSWGDSLINFLLSVSLLYFPAQMMWGEGRRDCDKVWHRPGTLVIPSLSRGVTMSPICPYKVKAVWGEGLSVPGVITLLARCVAFTALSACSLHHYRETMPWHSTEIEKKQLSWTFIVVWWLVARGRVGVAISRLPTSQRESRPRCCAALDNSPVLLDFCRKHSLTLPKSARRSWKAWWEVSGGSLATQIHSSGSVTVIVLTVGSQLADSPAFTACLSARVSLLLTSVALWEAVRASMLTGVRSEHDTICKGVCHESGVGRWDMLTGPGSHSHWQDKGSHNTSQDWSRSFTTRDNGDRGARYSLQ